MKRIILTALVIFALNIAKAQEIATTESGKKVMLFDDGTYKVISSKLNSTDDTSLNTSSQVKPKKVQCSGVRKGGSRCIRMVTSANGKCYEH